jgi:hypothetical protein
MPQPDFPVEHSLEGKLPSDGPSLPGSESVQSVIEIVRRGADVDYWH